MHYCMDSGKRQRNSALMSSRDLEMSIRYRGVYPFGGVGTVDEAWVHNFPDPLSKLVILQEMPTL